MLSLKSEALVRRKIDRKAAKRIAYISVCMYYIYKRFTNKYL